MLDKIIDFLKKLGSKIADITKEICKWLYENRYRILGGGLAITAGVAASAAIGFAAPFVGTGAGLAAIASVVGAAVTMLVIAAIKLTVSYYKTMVKKISEAFARAKISYDKATAIISKYVKLIEEYSEKLYAAMQREEEYKKQISTRDDEIRRLSESLGEVQKKLADYEIIKLKTPVCITPIIDLTSTVHKATALVTEKSIANLNVQKEKLAEEKLIVDTKLLLETTKTLMEEDVPLPANDNDVQVILDTTDSEIDAFIEKIMGPNILPDKTATNSEDVSTPSRPSPAMRG